MISVSNRSKSYAFAAASIAVLAVGVGAPIRRGLPALLLSPPGKAPSVQELNFPLVFVSRPIPPNGSLYYTEANDLPGVGARSRFRNAAPGKLLVREADGSVRTLIDGSAPSAASLNLIDVNAPDVSYDGQWILFAGLPQGNHSRAPGVNLGAWRIYVIHRDGTGLRQVTQNEPELTLDQLKAQFPADTSGYFQAANRFFNEGYDDTDPCWLPDGRICFSSTRYFSVAQYSGVRTTNLFVVNGDGTDLHRITTEKNGADRPTVDPKTGQIVFARWWRNHRFAVDSMATKNVSAGAYPVGGYLQKDGLSADRDVQTGGGDFLFRNAWHAATIRPDGTDLAMFTGSFRSDDPNHSYGGSFDEQGRYVANYFPMPNMTEAAGFGGIRRFPRGAGPYEPILGITYPTLNHVRTSPPSYGIYRGEYVTEPAVLPGGDLVVSVAKDIGQDYGLYQVTASGARALLYDLPGTSELRAKPLVPRPLPPVLGDAVSIRADRLPPKGMEDIRRGGTFSFRCLNVYFNAPVDVDIVSAPAIGSADNLRFYADPQRTTAGSFPTLDWPFFLRSAPVTPEGFVNADDIPADVPLFEQLRTAGNLAVPFTGNSVNRDGAAHVAGLNFGRPGTVQRCVGCHAGHSMIPVPANDEDAAYTNVAPGATLTVSSARDPRYNGGLIDRRVKKGDIWRYWNSAVDQQTGQWALLKFPVKIKVRTVRLYNPRYGDVANSSIKVNQSTVELLNGDTVVASNASGPVATTGTDVEFAEVVCTAVRVRLDHVTGTFYGARLASLAEVEVIAKGVNP